jgi:hypothetical protein
MKFVGRAKRIEDIDLPRVGRMIGVGEDEVHAILDVESAGSGFDAKGRPKMLFEPHVFYRNLKGAERDRAVAAGLAYPRWKRSYPKDSYPRLAAAMKINETAALRAASWGLGQILGENHKKSGYATPQAMVADFIEDEDNHLEAMIRFIRSANLAKHLKAHNWKAFARGYNGAGFAANRYDKKLADSFAKWKRIKDTPYTGNEPVEPAEPVEPPKPAPKPVPTPKPAPKPIEEPEPVEPVELPPEVRLSLWQRIVAWFRSLFSFKRRPDRTVKGLTGAAAAGAAAEGSGVTSALQWLGESATSAKDMVAELVDAAPVFSSLLTILAVIAIAYAIWAPAKEEAVA